MADHLTLDFCEVHLYDNYMVVTVNTGENISLEYHHVLQGIADTHFKDTPFVYITHRINSYSVDPSVYAETSKIKNLVGFCVVSKNYMAKSAAKIEQLFLDKPFEIFDTLPEAIEWSKTITK
ncbi:hypothetical protein SAMN04515667_2605 [Formosa sp. Hel1_31_208]|uniref:hypothetical protein n=1 Tax=Formosa sp. Hel1_31_208 TaxID=1798225 RepID=UPI00087AE500|nr:hypothetical protein [Formosa sp. Hel1_31_208]SDS62778.1 hypothetical protein SAMN04515667_2605 [Formosa sp. Hel1_31_208]